MSDKDRAVDDIREKFKQLLTLMICKNMMMSDKDIVVDDIRDSDRASCRDFRQA